MGSAVSVVSTSLGSALPISVITGFGLRGSIVSRGWSEGLIDDPGDRFGLAVGPWAAAQGNLRARGASLHGERIGDLGAFACTGRSVISGGAPRPTPLLNAIRDRVGRHRVASSGASPDRSESSGGSSMAALVVISVIAVAAFCAGAPRPTPLVGVVCDRVWTWTLGFRLSSSARFGSGRGLQRLARAPCSAFFAFQSLASLDGILRWLVVRHVIIFR